MKRLRLILLALAITVLSLLVGELAPALFLPVTDPLKKDKLKILESHFKYISSEHRQNWMLKTSPEPGLPGIAGENTFSTNNAGFRGDPLADPAPDDEFRVFAVGGSTTECLYLDDSKSFTRVLQNYLAEHVNAPPVVKVYGAAKSGDASDDHVSMIAQRIVHLEPDLVIVFAGINDLNRSMVGYDYLHFGEPPSKRLPLFKFLITEFQIGRRLILLRRRLLPSSRQVLESITSRSNYRDKVKAQQEAPASTAPPSYETRFYESNLKTICGIAAANGFNLMFMTQQTTWDSQTDPEAKQWHWMRHVSGVVHSESDMEAAMSDFNESTVRVAEAFDVPVFELTAAVPKSLEFFYDDVHFNEAGAEWTGKQLGQFIVERGLVD